MIFELARQLSRKKCHKSVKAQQQLSLDPEVVASHSIWFHLRFFFKYFKRLHFNRAVVSYLSVKVPQTHSKSERNQKPKPSFHQCRSSFQTCCLRPRRTCAPGPPGWIAWEPVSSVSKSRRAAPSTAPWDSAWPAAKRATSARWPVWRPKTSAGAPWTRSSRAPFTTVGANGVWRKRRTAYASTGGSIKPYKVGLVLWKKHSNNIQSHQVMIEKCPK